MKIGIRILLLCINILVAFILLCCLTSLFFNPTSFQFFEIIALGFPIIFVINLLCAISWLFTQKHKHYCILSLLLTILCLPTITDYFAINSNTKGTYSEYNSIKIVSYNIMGFNYSGINQIKQTKENIINLLEKESPDIVCFQEYANDTYTKFKLANQLKGKLQLSYVHSNKSSNDDIHGNVIFSKYPIIANGELDFPLTGNSTIWIDIVKNNDTIRIYNSHLKSYRLTTSDKQAIDELGKVQNIEVEEMENVYSKLFNSISKRGEQVDILSQSIKDCPYHIISCGDFNSPPCSYTYHTIKKDNNLKDAFLEAGSGIGETFNWWPHLRLDYILFDAKYDCIQYTRIINNVSDHYPITCTLTINQ